VKTYGKGKGKRGGTLHRKGGGPNWEGGMGMNPAESLQQRKKNMHNTPVRKRRADPIPLRNRDYMFSEELRKSLREFGKKKGDLEG